jgi:hypothetical protein
MFMSTPCQAGAVGFPGAWDRQTNPATLLPELFIAFDGLGTSTHSSQLGVIKSRADEVGDLSAGCQICVTSWGYLALEGAELMKVMENLQNVDKLKTSAPLPIGSLIAPTNHQRR